MRHRGTFGSVVLVGALMVLGACGGSSGNGAGTNGTPSSAAADLSPAGDIPDTQAFVPYHPPLGGYTLSVPEGWARTDLPDATEFSDKFNGIRVEQSTAASAPTVLSVQADLVPGIRAGGGLAITGATRVGRAAGTAIRIAYVQVSAPDPTTGKKVALAVERYLFWKNGVIVSVTLSGAKGADNVDPWRTVTNSFAWST